MNKRQKKKTQKELGFEYIGAWITPELKNALTIVAASNGRSVASELAIIVKAHVTAERLPN